MSLDSEFDDCTRFCTEKPSEGQNQPLVHIVFSITYVFAAPGNVPNPSSRPKMLRGQFVRAARRGPDGTDTKRPQGRHPSPSRSGRPGSIWEYCRTRTSIGSPAYERDPAS